MKIQINFDDFTVHTCNSLEEAKEAILEAHANGVGVDRVAEVNDLDEEIKVYGCNWTVSLEPI